MKTLTLKSFLGVAMMAFGLQAQAMAQESCSIPQEEKFEAETEVALQAKVQAFVDQKQREGYLIDSVDSSKSVEQVEVSPEQTKTVNVTKTKNVFAPSWKNFRISLTKPGAARRFWGRTSCGHPPRNHFAPEIDFGQLRLTKKKSVVVGTKEVIIKAKYKEVEHFFAKVTYHKEPPLEVRMQETTVSTPPVPAEKAVPAQGGGKKVVQSAGKKAPARTGSRPARRPPSGSTSETKGTSSSSKTFEVKQDGQWKKITEAEYQDLLIHGAKKVQ